MEVIFNAVYLITVITLGILTLRRASGNRETILAGVMAITLGSGDAFHLVPRIIALSTTGLSDYTVFLGWGKMVTSITMTAFYVLLFYIWRLRYQKGSARALTLSVWALAALRVILCFCPQNEWPSATPSVAWGIYRNLPFAVLGALIVVLFVKSVRETNDRACRHVGLAVTVSFLCYIPVVVWAEAFPPIGILMIPKTCAYVWLVLIFFFDARNRSKARL